MNNWGRNSCQTIAFVLCENFSTIALASAIEPLRLANRQMEKPLYCWRFYSANGNPVRGSSNLEVNVDGQISTLNDCTMIMLVSGLDIERIRLPHALISRIRYFVSHGTAIGAVCTASYLLAKMGLLDNYVCTIHWENIDALREEFPDIKVTENIFEVDRNRYTCAGGTAAIDMMLHFIAMTHGKQLAISIAETSLHHIIRSSQDLQRLKLSDRLGINHAKLIEAIELMQQNIENPMRCFEIAAKISISARQLERLFQKYLNVTPTNYYLKLRLERARFLLRHTSQAIMQITVSCGFVSASHFSKCYREQFNSKPSDRRLPLWGN